MSQTFRLPYIPPPPPRPRTFSTAYEVLFTNQCLHLLWKLLSAKVSSYKGGMDETVTEHVEHRLTHSGRQMRRNILGFSQNIERNRFGRLAKLDNRQTENFSNCIDIQRTFRVLVSMRSSLNCILCLESFKET